MIQKIYKVTCDNCYRLIGHYFDYKPSMKEIHKNTGAIMINNGTPRLLCKKMRKHNRKENNYGQNR